MARSLNVIAIFIIIRKQLPVSDWISSLQWHGLETPSISRVLLQKAASFRVCRLFFQQPVFLHTDTHFDLSHYVRSQLSVGAALAKCTANEQPPFKMIRHKETKHHDVRPVCDVIGSDGPFCFVEQHLGDVYNLLWVTMDLGRVCAGIEGIIVCDC